MLKKISMILIIISLTLGLAINVSAANLKTRLDIVQQASETKYLENDQGYVSKTIVDSNAEAGEVTVELKVSNTSRQATQQIYENTEIYIIVSENLTRNEEKFAKRITEIEALSNKIFDYSSKIKIGIIGMTGTVCEVSEDENGKRVYGENDQVDVDGTATNAEIIVSPTDSADTITSGLENMNTSKTNYYSNLQAAIRLANNSYSQNVNKILISLYDGVPNVAIGVSNYVMYGGASQYRTAEEGVKAKHEQIVTKTKNEILTLKDNNVSFILLRPDDTSYDETWYSTITGAKILEFDGSPYVQMLYGTIDTPTYGKMYEFTEEDLDNIITESIYTDVTTMIQQEIKNAKIVDYFPEDITDNFEFSYVGKPSNGTISNTIDKEDNTISWDIGTLQGNEVATVRYKLKLKNMQDTNLLDKVIKTNEKAVLTYKDTNDNSYTVTLDSSPSVKLTRVEENAANGENNGEGKDDTVAKTPIPQTGEGMLIFIIVATMGIAVFAIIRFIKYKDIK